MNDLIHSRNLAVRPRAGCFPGLFLLLVVMAGVGMLAGEVTAQTFKTLYSFTAIPPYPGPYPNTDGAYPQAGVILSGNTLYGTTELGGTWAAGTVFKVNTDGTGFTNLHSFRDDTDGGFPKCLIVSGNTLYGTASTGMGTVFALNTDGTGLRHLHSFSAISGNGLGDGINYDGVYPSGLVVLSNTLYGTASFGGTWAAGTVFKVNTDGTGFIPPAQKHPPYRLTLQFLRTRGRADPLTPLTVRVDLSSAPQVFEILVPLAGLLNGPYPNRKFRLERETSAAKLVFSMVRTCTMPLADAELRLHLESGDAISFVGAKISLQTIERQVDHLGFGELYIVSATQGRQDKATRIQVKPFAIPA